METRKTGKVNEARPYKQQSITEEIFEVLDIVTTSDFSFGADHPGAVIRLFEKIFKKDTREIK